MWFADQVAIITGASSGLGWWMAKVLAGHGCKVGLIARRQDRLDAVAAEIRREGGTAAVAVADVAVRQQTFDAIHALAGELGPVDLLIANSGVARPTPVEPLETEQVEQMIRVNLFGVIYAIDAVLPAMLQRGRGHLVAISSLAAYKGFPGESGYCASKAGINAYMEGLRITLRQRGIAVTTVCPGFIRTPMTQDTPFPTPQPWLMEPDKAARRIIRAIRRRRNVYNFPWQTTLLIRVTRWLPDWILARVLAGHTPDGPPK
jgi:short-subunit dehydrogenase